MDAEDLSKLVNKLEDAISAGEQQLTVALIGELEVIGRVVRELGPSRIGFIAGVYLRGTGGGNFGAIPTKNIAQIRNDRPSIIVVASDVNKEMYLAEVLQYLDPNTRIFISGFGHFEFADPIFKAETEKALIPSLANGYPNSLIHIFQCLKNAARLRLDGVVAEFGMFKGGTTMLISRFIEALGANWKVYGFDSFAGFPPPRSPLDMYAHPDCVFLDEQLVRRMFEGRNVTIVLGDIVQTASTIKGMPIVLAFVDTDNFSPASAVLDVIEEQVLPGGAIVFDHFTGQNRFLNTLGERIAAKRLLQNPKYFNLHDSGVFIRLS